MVERQLRIRDACFGAIHGMGPEATGLLEAAIIPMNERRRQVKIPAKLAACWRSIFAAKRCAYADFTGANSINMRL
jgi:hypothetical protein